MKEKFIEKARNKWGYKYDYSRVEYINYRTPVIIGYKGKWYKQTPDKHLQGKAIEKTVKKITTEEFISLSKELWEDRFEYDKCEYLGSNKKVILYDNLNEQWIEQIAKSHLNGHEVTKIDKERFIERCNIIHNFKYSYEDIKYTNLQSIINIKCHKHGFFNLKASSHLYGSICNECEKNKYFLDVTKFLEKYNLTFNRNHTFKDCRFNGIKLNFDFYIPSLRTCIELQDYNLDSYKVLKEIEKTKIDYCEYNYINIISIKSNNFDNIFNILWQNFKNLIKS